MLKTMIIGYLGADAEVKSANGREFTTFRIAHTDKWTDDAGQVHEDTIWVDCIQSGSGKLNEYLKKGQMVYVAGSAALRVYSSAKDRCMKAGLTIRVQQVELLGSRSDEIPSKLFKSETGEAVTVRKFYHSAECVQAADDAPDTMLLDSHGHQFKASAKGWISSAESNQENSQQ